MEAATRILHLFSGESSRWWVDVEDENLVVVNVELEKGQNLLDDQLYTGGWNYLLEKVYGIRFWRDHHAEQSAWHAIVETEDQGRSDHEMENKDGGLVGTRVCNRRWWTVTVYFGCVLYGYVIWRRLEIQRQRHPLNNQKIQNSGCRHRNLVHQQVFHHISVGQKPKKFVGSYSYNETASIRGR